MNYLRNITKDDGILSFDKYGRSKWSQLHNITASSHDNDDYLNYPNIRRELTGFYYLNDYGTSSF